MKKAYDAIIVGAGHNGLVAANYLSKANKKVLVLEQRHLVGGASLTEELTPGFKFSRCSYVLSLFRKQIIKELDLFNKGLKIYYRDISSITPTREVGKYLLLHSNQKKTLQEIAKFSKKDAEAYPKYEQFLSNICAFWDQNVDHIPYNFMQNPGIIDKYEFVKRVYRKNFDYFDLGRFFTSSVEQMVDTWFQSDILKAALATDGIIGENLSVSHHSTAYVLLHHVMGELQQGKQGCWGYVQGGNGKLSQILAKGAIDLGAQIRVNSQVQEIIYDGDKPKAVKLRSGEIIQAKAILSNCTNRVTFTKLIKNPQSILSAQNYNKIKNIQYNGAATKINLALKRLPKFKAFRGSSIPQEQYLQGTVHINCDDMAQVKRAYNQTKTHRISKTPFMDITMPSIYDKTMCPQGYHIMNCFLQYTPYIPNNGDPTTQISHQQIKKVFFAQMNEYLDEPLDVHFMDILTPFDLQRLIGLTEGNIFHGSIGLENIFVNRLSGQIGGVWLCGSSAHPGGGVMGAVGRQAAMQLLKSGQI